MPEAMKDIEGLSEAERQKEVERLTELLERPVKANLAVRAIYRWFLEFLRNCMVVAALFYVARRSGDRWLYGIAGLGGFALAAYCYTYIENGWWQLEMSKKGWFLTKRWWLKHVIVLASVVALQSIVIGITIGLIATVDRIVAAQGQIIKAP